MNSYVKGKIKLCGSKNKYKNGSKNLSYNVKLCRPLKHNSIKTASKFTKKQISKAKKIKLKGQYVNWNKL